MRKIILMMLLAVVSNSAMAEWVRFSGGKQITSYVDPATILKAGDKVKMWSMSDYKTAQINTISGKPYMSYMSQDEYDCKEKRWRALDEASFYSGNMGRGEVIYKSSSDEHTDWIQLSSGPFDDMWKNICAY